MKRIFSLFLALILCMSLLPVATAFADDDYDDDDDEIFEEPYVEEDIRYTLTIVYKAEDARYQSEMPKPVVKKLRYNVDYNVPSPEVEGFSTEMETVRGSMPDRNLTITVTYTRTQGDKQTNKQTNAKTYKVAIVCRFPKSADGSAGVSSIALVYTFADGDQYHIDLSNLFSMNPDAFYNAISIQDAATSSNQAGNMQAILYFTDELVPDKKVVEGTIRGEDVTEIVTFTVPQS